MEIVLWLSLAALIHGFFVFPKAAGAAAAVLKRKIDRDLSFEPTVTLFVPAYNEEKVIAAKIRNALALDYPAEKLEIMICSDCSSDNTGEIVSQFEAKYDNITFFDYRERSGKTGLINRSVPKARGEIIVLTDANTMFEPNVIKTIVSAFSSQKIGAVLGQVKLFVPQGAQGLDKEVSYRDFESKIKYIEGLFGCAMGAFGGLYAIRKSLFTPLPANAYSNDDFLTPVKILMNGHKVVFDRDAVTLEETGADVREEFGRRIRIGAGNFQSFSFLLPLLNPFKFDRFFFYVSHKVIRWFSPFILLALFISTAYTACSDHTTPFYRILLGGQLFFYLFALTGWGLNKAGVTLPVISSIYHFTAMNAALLLGFKRFLKGIKSAAWNSTERHS